MYTAPFGDLSGGNRLSSTEGGISGLSGILRRLYTVRGECAKGMERGLYKAGLYLQRKSQELVPVDTGALKASAFTQVTGSGFMAEVKVGYSQRYAIYVHEMLELWHKPPTSAKFLERPAKEHRNKMIEIIRREAQRQVEGGPNTEGANP